MGYLENPAVGGLKFEGCFVLADTLNPCSAVGRTQVHPVVKYSSEKRSMICSAPHRIWLIDPDFKSSYQWIKQTCAKLHFPRVVGNRLLNLNQGHGQPPWYCGLFKDVWLLGRTGDPVRAWLYQEIEFITMGGGKCKYDTYDSCDSGWYWFE